MSEMQGFGKLFVERSVKMLDTNWTCLEKQDVEVTTLVSCVLSLLCLVESGIDSKQGRTELETDKFEAFFANVPLFYEFYHSDFDETAITTSQSRIISNESFCNASQNNGFKGLIKKIRNAFAHGNVLPTNESGKWVAIRAWNRKDDKKSNYVIDFVFEIEVNKLLQFYKELASVYKESVK